MRSTRTNIGLLAGMIALILLTVLLNGFIPKRTSSRHTTTSTCCSRPARRRRSSPR
jgi:hypothetical protein